MTEWATCRWFCSSPCSGLVCAAGRLLMPGTRTLRYRRTSRSVETIDCTWTFVVTT
jgi:hypothetical protein